MDKFDMNNLNITSQCCGSAVAVLLLYAVHLSGKSEDGFGRRMDGILHPGQYTANDPCNAPKICHNGRP